jgi:formate dehydrogenase major subunit
MVEANGRLVRACATGIAEGMEIATKSAKAAAAQAEAFDRIPQQPPSLVHRLRQQ